MRLLAADIGGTNTRLALALGDTHGVRLSESRTRPSEDLDADGLVALVKQAAHEWRVAAIVVAVAGPVRDGVCEATNLPFRVEESSLAEAAGVPTRLVNDFHAMATGAAAADRGNPEEVRVVHSAPVAPGPTLVVGPGTGLGQAYVVGDDVLATEGGHVGFAPQDAWDEALLRWLRGHFPRVSSERVVSGPGLAMIYEYICQEGLASHSSDLRRAVAEEGAVALGRALLSSDTERGGAADNADNADNAARLAVERFARAYGGHVGDAVLSPLCPGGALLCGGLTTGLFEVMRDPFLESYVSRGRMRNIAERTAVCLVMGDDVGLQGAARLAARLAGP